MRWKSYTVKNKWDMICLVKNKDICGGVSISSTCDSLGHQKSTFLVGRNSLRQFSSISENIIVGKDATPTNFIVDKPKNLTKFHLI